MPNSKLPVKERAKNPVKEMVEEQTPTPIIPELNDYLTKQINWLEGQAFRNALLQKTPVFIYLYEHGKDNKIFRNQGVIQILNTYYICVRVNKADAVGRLRDEFEAGDFPKFILVAPDRTYSLMVAGQISAKTFRELTLGFVLDNEGAVAFPEYGRKAVSLTE